MSNNTQFLTHHLLVATPSLIDGDFSKAVIYLYEHTAEGAMGIMINKPLRLTVGEVVQHLELSPCHESVEKMLVLAGGPVAREQGFLLAPRRALTDEEHAINDNPEVVVSTSRNLLQKVALGEGPSEVLIALGYCGWSAGQLEQELANNFWLTVPYEQHILFQTPYEKRWHAAAALIGVDLNKLALDAGHA